MLSHGCVIITGVRRTPWVTNWFLHGSNVPQGPKVLGEHNMLQFSKSAAMLQICSDALVCIIAPLCLNPMIYSSFGLLAFSDRVCVHYHHPDAQGGEPRVCSAQHFAFPMDPVDLLDPVQRSGKLHDCNIFNHKMWIHFKANPKQNLWKGKVSGSDHKKFNMFGYLGSLGPIMGSHGA